MKGNSTVKALTVRPGSRNTEHYTTGCPAPAGIEDLRSRRLELGLTLAQASARVQGRLAPCQLANIERGLRPPAKRVAEYAVAYDLSEEGFWRRWSARAAVPVA